MTLRNLLVLALLLAVGCAAPRITSTDFPAAPRAEPRKSPALPRLAQMAERYDVATLVVLSSGVDNQTSNKEAPPTINSMVAAALTELGPRVLVRPSTPLPVPPSSGANGADYDVAFEGSITEFDQGLVKASRDTEISLTIGKGDGGATFDSEALGSRVAADFFLRDPATDVYLPFASTSSSACLVERKDADGAGLAWAGTGVWVNSSYITKQGVHMALRNLVEMSVIELIGRHLGLPYWRCIEGAPRDVAMIERMRRQFRQLDEETFNKNYLKRMVFMFGDNVDVTTGTLNDEEKRLIKQRQIAYNAFDNRELWLRMWEELPYEGRDGSLVEANLIAFRKRIDAPAYDWRLAETILRSTSIEERAQEIAERTREVIEADTKRRLGEYDGHVEQKTQDGIKTLESESRKIVDETKQKMLRLRPSDPPQP